MQQMKVFQMDYIAVLSSGYYHVESSILQCSIYFNAWHTVLWTLVTTLRNP